MERAIVNTKNESAQRKKPELSAPSPIAVIVFRPTICCNNAYFTTVT